MGLPDPLLPSSFPGGESPVYTVCEMVHEISIPSGWYLSYPQKVLSSLFGLLLLLLFVRSLEKFPWCSCKKTPKICWWEFYLVNRAFLFKFSLLGKCVFGHTDLCKYLANYRGKPTEEVRQSQIYLECKGPNLTS